MSNIADIFFGLPYFFLGSAFPLPPPEVCFLIYAIIAFMATVLYRGSKAVVKSPEIRIAQFNKDFYFGFYCTIFQRQAKRWAVRFTGKGIMNEYLYTPNGELKTLSFPEMTEEWLDFIVHCRSGKSHGYDIVEGPMANDTIFNYIQNFIDGKISRSAFWELARFKKPA